MTAEQILALAGALALLGAGLGVACFGAYNLAVLLGEMRGIVRERALKRMLAYGSDGLRSEIEWRLHKALTKDERQSLGCGWGSRNEQNAVILATRVLFEIVRSSRLRRPRQRLDKYPRCVNDSGLEVDR